MTDRNQALLRIPQGTERFSLDEAYRHRRLVHGIEDFYQRWGYLPAQTPVVDFFDVYDRLMTPSDRRGTYRLIDRDGEVLLLRSDVTLFLAKQMGLALRTEDLPVRVYYSDTILRHQEAYDISRNEFFQTGVELIGPAGLDGELEVLVLLFELLKHVGCPRFFCHIGSRQLLQAGLLGGEPVESGGDYPAEPSSPGPNADAAVRRAVSLRRFDSLGDLAGSRLTPARRNLYELIIGGEEFLRRLPDLRSDLCEAEGVALERLSGVVKGLLELGYGDVFRIDFSEIGNQSYHSGIAFQTYIHGVDSAIAAGGRYDGLLRRFGFDAASVGFSVMLRKLEPRLSRVPSRPVGSAIEARETTVRLAQAREIVRKGGSIDQREVTDEQ